MTPTMATALVLALTVAYHASLAAAAGPRVIIVGAGMSGISAGKRLSEAGITDLVILEATDHIGGRMHKTNFAGINVEMGANWVEGVNGGKMNPIWPIVNSTLKLRNFLSDFDYLASNVYKEKGGLYDAAYAQKRIDRSDEVEESGGKLSATLHPSGRDDMSILAMQRLNDHMPNGPSSPLDMVLDYYKYDYEYAEPPRVTSLQNVVPLPTFEDFGDDVYFVADPRGYEAVVYYLAGQYLRADKAGSIVDPRLRLKQVVREISYSGSGVTVKTEDGKAYRADYVMVSASVGVLQSDLIQFKPQLPVKLEGPVHLPIRHGRVHQDLRQVPQEVLARGERQGVLPLREQQERVLRSVAGVRGAVPRLQRSPGHRHRRGVEADRAAVGQPDQGGDRGGAEGHVPRRGRPRRHGHPRPTLVVRQVLQGHLLQLAHRRQPLRIRPAQGASWEGLLHRGAHQRALQWLCPWSLSRRY